MEICRCEQFKEVVEKFNFFLCGTLHHLEPRKQMPEGYCIKWVRTKISPLSPRFLKPMVVKKSGAIHDITEKPQPEIETKWIPVLPGLISQKIVNENRTRNMLLV
ncbi:hypothetical protein Zmor_027898 [Zophobas morio]|uniref:Uncharacterized protein n=1 Tax=Zophobas morio TaxID=2755281 RepID=A0AA38HP29_9CUCU|nr:hypothetical protein Zmor_027898 [Zophobas morio]